MSVLRIVDTGPTTSIQDGGRTGYLRLGVSESGPMDWVSHNLANAILGNQLTRAGIEFGLGGLEVEAIDGPLDLAFVGTDVTATLGPDTLSGPHRLTLLRGQSLRLNVKGQSLWGYLAIAGGVDLPAILGSLSTNRRTGLGPVSDLQGLRLEVPNAPAIANPVRYLHPFQGTTGAPMRLIKGPQDDMFDDKQLSALTTRSWQISQRIDRMGYRLDGERLQHARGADIVSDGIVLGAIQVPGDGLPTILMADRQPTGGYPKIATMIRADLPRLAQSRPGSTIKLAWTNTDKAVAELKALHLAISRPQQAIRDSLSSEMLLSINLIDGVIAQTPET